MANDKLVKIGTCSWKYDSWTGLVYSNRTGENYLKQYAAHYKTVEIDQWFWSLFANDKVKLPEADTIAEYAASVPEDFEFTVKVPNSITLTHHYNRNRRAPLQENPYFLSNQLFDRFLQRLEPLHSRLGALIFQFEYLNRQKMPNQQLFLQKLGEFIGRCPKSSRYAVETRNPNYLNTPYFRFLNDHALFMVFLQGYYMPAITDIYQHYRDLIKEMTIIRLHGPNRREIEKQTQQRWDRLVAPKDEDLEQISQMINDLMRHGIEVYVNVNNHYEGSAPRTIERMVRRLEA